MKNGDNDNEELSFIALSAATANVIRWLSDNSEQERDKVKGGQEKQDQPTDEQRKETERADLERRIRDMTAMERRLTRKRI